MLSHVVAVGDIHGQLSLLLDLAHNAEQQMRKAGLTFGRHWTFLFLGDYIDRGPDSEGVVEALIRFQSRGAICLRGNHEQMALDRHEAKSDGRLRVELDRAASATARADHIAWFGSLPMFYETESHFFVHAGVHPDIPLAQQARDQDPQILLWIRERFLDHQQTFEKYVVHGHTTTRQWDADVRHNRCNLDTGAGRGRTLSAAVFALDRKLPVSKISVGWPSESGRG